jgi:hypothetical protein
MTVYVASAIPINDVEALFCSNWCARNNCEIPKPLFSTTDIVRVDPSEQWGACAKRAFVNIQVGLLEERQVGYSAEAVHQTLPVTLDIWTLRECCCVCGGTGRQHLWDVKDELRRIAFVNKHSLQCWQRIIYNSFTEVYEDSVAQRFHGTMELTLCNDGLNTPTEELDNDLFTRADGAIGGEWTNVAGTWCVTCNQAQLSTATANAHTRFVGPCCCSWPNNVRVTVDITTVACMEAGLVFRWQNLCNYWRATLEEACCVRYVRLTHRCCGTDTQYGEVRASLTAPTWVVGDRKMLEVELYDSTIIVNLDGQTNILVCSTILQTETDFGLFADNCTTVRFDCFRLAVAAGSGR